MIDASEGLPTEHTPHTPDTSRPVRRRPVGPELERYGPIMALLIVAAGGVLRARGLSDFWLNGDEGIYYSTLTRTTFDAFWAEVLANAHPPGFYLLLRGAGVLTWDFVWLRGLSVCFGVASIWIFWRLGRDLGGSGPRGVVSGLAAAAIVALNPQAIVLSQVIRPYTLVVFLLGGALLSLLRYRRDPGAFSLLAYAAFLSLAVLTHYSAALALLVFSLVVVHDAVTGLLPRPALQPLLAGHAVPAAILVGLYALHLDSALESDLMADALNAGGWLDRWLIDSPAAAWQSLAAYQSFHVPASLLARSVLALVAVVITALVARRPVIALLTAGAVLTAVAASAAGVYPLGPTRHNAWLTVFTVPALGWLLGCLFTVRSRAALAGGGLAAIAVWAAGSLLEPTRSGDAGPGRSLVTIASSEQAVRRDELGPLIVERMAPDGSPELIVMTQQSYNVLMPLYPRERESAATSSDGTLSHFRYGSRDIVVLGRWDWSGVGELARVLDRLPEALPWLARDPAEAILVVAGGWGSALFSDRAALDDAGAIVAQTWAFRRDAAGTPQARMMALVVDPSTLRRVAAARSD